MLSDPARQQREKQVTYCTEHRAGGTTDAARDRAPTTAQPRWRRQLSSSNSVIRMSAHLTSTALHAHLLCDQQCHRRSSAQLERQQRLNHSRVQASQQRPIRHRSRSNSRLSSQTEQSATNPTRVAACHPLCCRLQQRARWTAVAALHPQRRRRHVQTWQGRLSFARHPHRQHQHQHQHPRCLQW